MEIKVQGDRACAYGMAYLEQGAVKVSFSLPEQAENAVWHARLSRDGKQIVSEIADGAAEFRRLEKGAYNMEVICTMPDGQVLIRHVGVFRVRALYDSLRGQYALTEQLSEQTDRARIYALETRVDQLEEQISQLIRQYAEMQAQLVRLYAGYDPFQIGMGNEKE